MKFFSVALVAALFCTAVIAAPEPNGVFEDVAYGPIDEILKRLKQYVEVVKCGLDVTQKIINENEGDLKKDFDQLKKVVDDFVQNDLKKCSQTAGIRNKFQCTVDSLAKVSEALRIFLENVEKKNEKIAEQIRQEFNSKCLKRSPFIEAYAQSLPDQFECIIKVLGEASKANGMTDQWTKAEPEFQRHIDAWKQCGNAGNKIAVIVCNIKEFVQTMKLYVQYVQEAAQSGNQKFIQDFIRGVQQKCAQ